MVKTAKRLLEKSPDPYMALLLPWCGLSPAELLMGRRIGTDVPQLKEQFVPSWGHTRDFQELEKKFKKSQKSGYEGHRVKDLPRLPNQLPVWATQDNC